MDAGVKIRVLLADDHAVVREGLRYIIDAQSDMEVVGEASDGRSAVSLTQSCAPDVVLMDIQMPNGTGLEATRAITRATPCARVVLLTTFDVLDYVCDGMRAGAVGYLLKDAETEELLAGVRWAHRGEAVYRTAQASRAIAALAGAIAGRQDAQSTPRREQLTPRESDILQEMAYGRRNDEIAARLHVSLGTVKSHVHRILQKLGVEDRTQAVVLAMREGLVK